MIRPALAVLVLGSAPFVGMACTSQTQAQTPPAALDWYVLNEINSFYLDIDDPMNRPPLVTELQSGVLVPVEINGDGQPDWLINWPDSGQFCGTGGCRRTLYVSKPDGLLRAFDRQGSALDIRTIEGETRIEVGVHHLYCDDRREDCRLAWAWDEGQGQLTERPSSDGNAVIHAPGADAVDLGDENGRPVIPDWTPSEVFTAVEAGRRICLGDDFEGGVMTTYPSLDSTPDLNADGFRDWVIGPPSHCPGEDEAPLAFQVWVSSGPGGGPGGRGGAATLAYEARGDVAAHVDVSGIPATLLVHRLCDGPGPCPTTSLRWEATTRRLLP